MISGSDGSELLLGLVAPVGVDLGLIQNTVSDYLKQFNYKTNPIRLSALITKIDGLTAEVVDDPPFDRVDSHMTAGNEARQLAGRGDVLAQQAMYEIRRKRKDDSPLASTAHLFNSLKHEDEVRVLRNAYGNGFFLLGIASSHIQRLKYLTEQLGLTNDQAEHLIRRDESEEFRFGQHMRDVFHLADGFVDIDAKDAREQVARILDLIFGKPFVTPTRNEYAMFLSFAASLRSCDLSRQVGAVVASKAGEIISTGANDVPCYGGGLYWGDDENDCRDYNRKCDPNEERRNEIAIKIMKQMNQNGKTEEELLEEGKKLLADTGIFDITEYGRAVHAEMEALLSCARSGVSPVGGTLYCTTFPCHNCAKHIVAAGISRVVFVEPYPKSQALNLHGDAIILRGQHESDTEEQKVEFQPFVGVGPLRFLDLFSMNLGSGRKLKRKENGVPVSWQRSSASMRVPLLAMSYIEREMYAVGELEDTLTEGGTHVHKQEE